MKLIGFSRKKLNDKTALLAVMNVIMPCFGKTGFSFMTEAGSNPGETDEFSFEEGLKILQRDNCLGFFRKDAVFVWIDNQAHNDRNWIHPHSTVKIELAEEQQNGHCSVQLNDWLEMAKSFVTATGMDLVIVIGKNENLADYLRTPLGVKIGLIKVFWIMCFGESYSKLIPDKRQATNFHKREEFNNGAAKAFVSAQSFDDYLGLKPQARDLQKMEIGQDLFNRLPTEEKQNGESGWLFNPKFLLRFLVFLFRRYTTNWSKYQAKVVPKD